MANAELQEFFSVLESRRRDILETLAGLKRAGQTVELDQAAVGRLSRMDAMAQQHMAQASERHLAIELRRIEAAIVRYENGSFGQCCHCQVPLTTDRLQADPAVPFCLACLSELAESRRRARRPGARQ